MSREPPSPRFRIERAPAGYRVIGPDLLIWEPSLGEAEERRAELEVGWWRHAAAPPAARAEDDAESLVYGPVASRRLGRSLGVNLTPAGCRLCTFDCVYCAWGGLPRSTAGASWPAPREIAAALAEALARVGPLDSITLSGHGEPTLHPRFPEVVAAVLELARAVRPGVAVRILTNASHAMRPEIRAALDRLDERIVKLDADAERVERPGRRQPLGALLAGLALLRDVTLQACFVEGEAANTGERSVFEWVELVAELAPRAVQIYTIDRQPAQAGILPAGAARLEEIACALRARTGIEASVHA
jgi:wyosine [tRNA(Phe)-imidazoG37] synthetase (radical SAM superfamily)